MNDRQRERLQRRRKSHAQAHAIDRPRVVLARTRYPDVKHAHIVPRVYQRPFAVNDQVAVHVDGRSSCVLMPTARAGTRSRYYRRWRPNGEPSDDIEASLSVIEDAVREPLSDLIAGEPLTTERKRSVAQLLGLQILRGPAFFEHRRQLIVPTLTTLDAKHFGPAGLASVGGDIEKARQKTIDAFLDPTMRFMTMLTTSIKVATVIAHMRWHVVRFDGPVLAYSDHPVVLWPMDVATSGPFERQGLGPASALEIRVPIAPDVAIVMNWIDRSDQTGVILPPAAASELNAFTVSQADRQWMHQPGSEPELDARTTSPISRLIDPTYDRTSVVRSERRARAQRFLERVRTRQHMHDVEVVVDVLSDYDSRTSHGPLTRRDASRLPSAHPRL